MIFRRITFFLLFFHVVSVFAQIQNISGTGTMDSLFFLNGEVRAVKIVDTAYHLIRFLPENKKKKPHILEVEKDKVFSLKFSNGQERIVYFQDSTIGNVFTVLEAKMFMLGEREADMHYRNKWPVVIGFAVGAVSPMAFANAVAISPIPAAIAPLHTLIPYIHINTKAIQNKNYLQYDTYIMGYEKVARKKNFMNALIGAGAGLAVGFGTWAVPDKTWSAIGVNTLNTTGDTHWKTVIKKNLPFAAVWAGEVGCAVGFSIWNYKKHKKVKK